LLAAPLPLHLADAPPASHVSPPVLHAPPPTSLTLTALSATLPVFVSVTTTVTVEFTSAGFGVTLFVVRAVAAFTTGTVPLACSPVAGTSLPSVSFPRPSADQLMHVLPVAVTEH